jgi:molecular chaperone DnaK
LKNAAEQIIFAAKKAVEDLGDEVTANEKANIERATDELQKTAEANGASAEGAGVDAEYTEG